MMGGREDWGVGSAWNAQVLGELYCMVAVR
jgi:hypothetical protein